MTVEYKHIKKGLNVTVSENKGYLEVSGLPKSSIIRYAAKGPDDTYFVVHRQKQYGNDSEHDVLRIGKGGGVLKPVNLKNITVLRDGGTTTYQYGSTNNKKAFIIPTSLEPEAKPEFIEVSKRYPDGLL
jgi:hypothetical protein